MKTTSLMLAAAVMTVLCGCGPSSPPAMVPPTGFLSDYSGLEEVSATTRRYVNPKYDFSKYSSFIVDPVEVYFKDKTGVPEWDDVERLRAYMRRTVISTLTPRYNAITTRPGPHTARIRIALTKIERSAPLRMNSVSMEAELLDSQTGEQMAAVIESRRKRFVLAGNEPWSGAKAIMDDWAKRFYTRLEESRGR